jgi:hypothetical protein
MMNYSYENWNRLTTSLTPMHDHLLLRSTEYLTRQRVKTELYLSYDNRYRVGSFFQSPVSSVRLLDLRSKSAEHSQKSAYLVHHAGNLIV